MTDNTADSRREGARIAVLIPCYNEELTIAKVVADMRRVLPTAEIYVYDNNSTDRTAEIARAAGARVCHEPRQGKGFVIQRMFAEIDADVYLMVDGDDTYPADHAREIIGPVIDGEADMVVGSRLTAGSTSEFKRLNRLGNQLFLKTINWIFGVRLTDILSGYRAFNRSFVKTLPLFGGGFEIESELTIKSLAKGYRIAEVPINLTSRPEGSESKINYIADGLRIMGMIFALFRDYKPLTFFGGIGAVLMAAGLVAGGIVVFEFIETGLVLRMPTTVLAVGFELAGMLLLAVGLVLHTVVRRSQEQEHQMRVLFDEIESLNRRDTETLRK